MVRGRTAEGVRIVQEDGTPVAADARRAGNLVTKGLGLMFRRSVPGDALVFPFERVATRRLHMVCVPFDIDAVWLVEGGVERVERLSAWTGHGAARADCVVELPAGAADDVSVGDRLRVEG
jgi:uncharacterized membrane protein (UPF0127 family)